MVERWGLTKDEYLVEKHGVEIPNSNQQLLSPAFSRTLFEPQEDSSKNIKFYLSVAISREENLPKSISKSFQQLDYLFVWNTCAKKKERNWWHWNLTQSWFVGINPLGIHFISSSIYWNFKNLSQYTFFH